MRHAAKIPLLLAAIAALLAGYILFVERDRPTTDEARAARQRLFPTFARAGVSAIEIDRGDQGRVLLNRGVPAGVDTDWTIGPEHDRAARGAIAELLDAIDGAESDREVSPVPAAAGLAPPAVRLAIVGLAGRAVLEIGATDASTRGVFVRRAGETRALVVGRRLRDLLDRPSAAFRDRRLFAAGIVDAATAVEFQSYAGPRQTLRKRAGLWLDERGFFAAQVATAEALRSLAALEATDFPPTGPPRPAAAPRQTLELTAGDRARLEIWNVPCATPADARPLLTALTPLAGGPPVWLCVDAATIDRLWRLLDTANQRERRLLPVDPVAADGVILTEGARRLHLRRDAGATWRFTEPSVSYAADPAVIDAWLAQLATTTIGTGSAPRVAAGPSRSLLIEGAQRSELMVATPSGASSRLERTGEPEPAAAAATLFADLAPDPLRFRSRAVLSLPRFDVTRIDIQSRSHHRTLRRAANETWIDDAKLDNPADPTAIERLLAALADLRADHFLPDETPFTPETTIDIEQRSADSTTHHRIELGSRCRARLADTSLFDLPAAACAALTQL